MPDGARFVWNFLWRDNKSHGNAKSILGYSLKYQPNCFRDSCMCAKSEDILQVKKFFYQYGSI